MFLPYGLGKGGYEQWGGMYRVRPSFDPSGSDSGRSANPNHRGRGDAVLQRQASRRGGCDRGGQRRHR